MAQLQKLWQPWVEEDEPRRERDHYLHNQIQLPYHCEYYYPCHYNYSPYSALVNTDSYVFNQPQFLCSPPRMEPIAHSEESGPSSDASGEKENDDEIDVVNIDEDDFIEKSIGDSKAYYKCDYCEREFPSKNRNHIFRCRNKVTKRFECSKCLKCFTLRATLNNHMKIHTGEKPFKCNHCGRLFRDLSTRNKHERTHTKEKPYRCFFCSFQSAQSGNCKRHMRQKHNQK